MSTSRCVCNLHLHITASTTSSGHRLHFWMLIFLGGFVSHWSWSCDSPGTDGERGGKRGGPRARVSDLHECWGGAWQREDLVIMSSSQCSLLHLFSFFLDREALDKECRNIWIQSDQYEMIETAYKIAGFLWTDYSVGLFKTIHNNNKQSSALHGISLLVHY